MPINLLSANHRNAWSVLKPGILVVGGVGGGLGRERWKLRPGSDIVLSLSSGLQKRRSRLVHRVSFVYLAWATAKQ
jgi:hypothetical protein